MDHKAYMNRSGIICKVVHTKQFSENQLNDVRVVVRQQLLTGNMHRYDPTVMSSNNTVNIFENHAMLWRMVALSNTTTLILEDDADPVNDNALLPLLEHMHANRAIDNYILKLQITRLHSFYNWTPVNLGNYTGYQCKCTPPIVNFGMVAYVLDPVGAETLLRMYMPIWTHVDTWIHHIGCKQHIKLMSTSHSMFVESGRRSIHRSTAQKPSVVEKIVHLVWDAMYSGCDTNTTQSSVDG